MCCAILNGKIEDNGIVKALILLSKLAENKISTLMDNSFMDKNYPRLWINTFIHNCG